MTATEPVHQAVPDVSLVVIAFNERVHAPTCVRAILDQRTDARFGVVFVDDGSTDGTAEAVAERSRRRRAPPAAFGCRRTAGAAQPARPGSRRPAVA